VLDVMTGLAQEGMTMICVTHEMGFAREVALSKLARQLDAGELRGRIIILPALGYPRWRQAGGCRRSISDGSGRDRMTDMGCLGMRLQTDPYRLEIFLHRHRQQGADIAHEWLRRIPSVMSPSPEYPPAGRFKIWEHLAGRVANWIDLAGSCVV
jgi:hypothetical protein